VAHYDISSKYEGVFFRVVGGGAGSFGTVQPQNAPRLEMVHTGYDNSKSSENHENGYSRIVPLSVTGWSDGLWTGDVVPFTLSDNSTNCGDWEQYKDEHCYKLFDGLRSYDDAEKVCQTNSGTLAVIHYVEEQNFLANYLFTRKKVVDNVWIGAKYIGNKLFQWEDHTPLTGSGYSHWAAGSPKNLTDHCVEMVADEGSEGKWVDERCARKNLAVCQKTQLPSVLSLAETVFHLKHSLEETNKKVAQLEKEAIPIGFTYVQLPKDKAPSELWPSLTWTDISSEYEGVFFRVVGGGAGSFGMVQQENAPRLERVYAGLNTVLNTGHVEVDHNMSIPVTGWSYGVATGAYDGVNVYTYFKHTDIAEVRPKNMAIKVYKRTA
ncbi:chromatin-modulating protein mrc1, partial [Tyrophagus putrescentiae]